MILLFEKNTLAGLGGFIAVLYSCNRFSDVDGDLLYQRLYDFGCGNRSGYEKSAVCTSSEVIFFRTIMPRQLDISYPG